MSTFILRNCRVLKTDCSGTRAVHDILIRDGVIAEIAMEHLSDEQAQVVDVGGRTVMPGLIDCHVHVVASQVNLIKNAHQPNVLSALATIPILEGMLARGFTSVRDAGGADYGLVQAIEEGVIRGPRIFPSGQALSQTGGHGDFRRRNDTLESCMCNFRTGSIARVVDGVDAVRLAVREEIQKGATQIKVMASGGISSPVDPIANTQYSLDELRAIVEEARAANSYVMAHAYTARAIRRAVECGVRTIEHGNMVDAATADVMAHRGAYMVPTTIAFQALALEGGQLGLSEESMRKLGEVLDSARSALTLLASAGVKMGFGSDLLGATHRYQSDELLIRAELIGTTAALRSATVDAAEILNMVGKLGVVAKDALADLLVVDGDPSTDIACLLGQGVHIKLIMKNGAVVKDELRVAN